MPSNPAIPAQNTENTSKTPFSALPYYKAALALIAQNPRLLAWKIASDILARATMFLIALLTISALTTSLFKSPEILQKPAFLIGLTGTAFTLWLITLFFNAFTHSGIYATITHIIQPPHSDGTSENTSENTKPSFFTSALPRLDATLGLQLISLAARTILVLLAAALAIALFSSVPLFTTQTRTTQTAILWAFGIATYMVFALLTRLTIELIAAPLFLQNHTLSDAILHAAHFVLEFPIQLYRLFIAMLTTMLIPMGVYFLLLMTQNAILMFAPPLAPLGLLFRFTADLFLFISLAAVAVIFYTAVFAFYGERRALWTTSYLEELMDNPEKSAPGFLRSLFKPANNKPTKPKSDFAEHATLTTLTPANNPNIVAFDQIFDPEILANFQPNPDENPTTDSQESTPPEINTNQPNQNPENDPNPNP